MLDVHSRDNYVPLVLFGGPKSSPAPVQLVCAYLRWDPLVANRRSGCSRPSLSERCFPQLVLLFSEVFSNCNTGCLNSVLELVKLIMIIIFHELSESLLIDVSLKRLHLCHLTPPVFMRACNVKELHSSHS